MNKELIIEQFIQSTKMLDGDMWAIKVNGKIAISNSGRTLFRKRTHALNALRHMVRIYKRYEHDDFGYHIKGYRLALCAKDLISGTPDRQEICKMLLEEGAVEIVQLSIKEI